MGKWDRSSCWIVAMSFECTGARVPDSPALPRPARSHSSYDVGTVGAGESFLDEARALTVRGFLSARIQQTR